MSSLSTHRGLRKLGLLVGTGGLLLALSGCGSVKQSDDVNLINGKQQFVAKCGSCHTLARANTKGIVGPNLDEAFRQSLAEGLDRSAIEGVVHGQVLVPDRDGVMPKGLASGATLNDIAAYVAKVVDRPGKDTGLLASAVEAPGAGKPAVEKAGKLAHRRQSLGSACLYIDEGDSHAGSGDDQHGEHVRRLPQHRDRTR